jgi:NADH-quinone oxidoreductase subunit M
MSIETIAQFPLLSLITFLPLAGVLMVAFVPRDEPGTLRNVGLGFSLLTFLVSLAVWAGFDERLAGLQMMDQLVWFDGSVSYALAVDGISLLLVMLTTFLTPIVILGAYRSITARVKEFIISMLVLETGMLGALMAVDLFLFYVFWEFMLIPMYLLIGVWGGPRRIYAAVKFFLYTMVGSLLMLVAIIYLYTKAGSAAFVDILRLELTTAEQVWLFLAFALAFAIKVPLFPFHTWLPDAHVEAPTAGSVILAGVLLKMGTYGFVRFAIPLFPEATGLFSMPIVLLAVVGIIYGALVAYAQTDVKKLVAYSSVSHLGFVMLGMFALTTQGVQGSILQMVNHGISTGALFLLVGVIYERRHTRAIADFGGLAKVMPAFSVIFLIITLSSIGLPGTNGFIGEFLILAGSFNDALYHVLSPPTVVSGWHWVIVAVCALVALGLVGRIAWRLGPGRRGRAMKGRDWALVVLQAAAAGGLALVAAVALDVPLPKLGEWRVFMLVMAGAATSGVVLGAVYMLSMVRRVFFGPVTHEENKGLKDLSAREAVVLIPLVAFVFLIGLAPNLFLSKTKASVDAWVEQYRPRVMATRAPETFQRKGQRLVEELRIQRAAREAVIRREGDR